MDSVFRESTIAIRLVESAERFGCGEQFEVTYVKFYGDADMRNGRRRWHVSRSY